MRSNYDLLIFDWDGTLIDSIGWIVSCLQHAALQNGVAVPAAQAARDVIGLSIQGAMQELFPDSDAPMQKRLIDSYREQYFSRQTAPEDLFDGVPDMLRQLKSRGYRLAVATGKNRNGLNLALLHTRTESLFDATRCADETASKPEPLMVHEIIRQLGVLRERTLIIGDSAHDLQMAVNAQIAAVAVACGAHSKEVLQQYRPLQCLDQTKELLAFL